MSNQKMVDSVYAHLHEISKFKVLSKEEERELIEKAQAGDIEARNKMVEHNLKLCVNIVKGFFRYYPLASLTFEDLIGEAEWNLFEAIRKFDLKSSYKFSTYAANRIVGKLHSYIVDNDHMIRKPRHISEKFMHYKIYVDNFIIENGREPSIKEISEDMGISEESVILMMTMNKHPVSLDRPKKFHDEEESFSGMFGKEEDFIIIMQNQDMAEQLKSILQTILTEKPRLYHVIAHRYGLYDGVCKTLEQVGKDLNITRERVRQLETQGKKLILKSPLGKVLKEMHEGYLDNKRKLENLR